jgi:preprotein translocase subunit SecB
MQLTRLRFEQVSVESNPDWKPDAKMLGVPFVGFDNVTLQRSTESATFRLFLGVRVPTSDAPSGLTPVELPYAVSVRVAADIAFFPEAGLDETAMRQMISFNGLATLYAFARDTVHQITAQAENGPFLLPVFNITDVSDKLLEMAAPIEGQSRPLPAPPPL